MPLSLGGIETERPQLIVYDPDVAAEVKEALEKRTKLLKQGFLLRTEGPGKIQLDPPPSGPNVRVFRVLSKEGDERIVWDRRDPNQVREAFAKFKEFIAKGYTAFAVRAGGKRGHKITEFDPGLEEILLSEKEVVLVPPTLPG